MVQWSILTAKTATKLSICNSSEDIYLVNVKVKMNLSFSLHGAKFASSFTRETTKWIRVESLKGIDWIFPYFSFEWIDLQSQRNICTVVEHKYKQFITQNRLSR